jgi:signal transduction histidine kinase
LVNGLKFTDAGGRVDLIARRSGSRVLLSVRDTGVGIGEDQVAAVFEPFHQGVRRPPNGWDGGSGLGLALARGLLRMEGAELGVDSTPDVGSTFTIAIPVGGTDAP